MKLSVKVFVSFFLLTIIFFFSEKHFCYADSNVPLDVANKAQKSFNEWLVGLEGDYKSYGLNSSDEAKNAKLGDGVKYYGISYKHLQNVKAKKETFSLNKLLPDNNQYIFPIEVENKAIGVAFVEGLGDNWQVVEISNMGTFEGNYKQALKNINSQESKDVMLVYDRPSNIIGVINKKSDSEATIIPIRDNKQLFYKQNVESTFTEKDLDKLNVSIESGNNDGTKNVLTGGGAYTTENNNGESHYYIYLVAIFCIILLCSSYVFLKYRTKHASNSNKNI